MQNKYMYMYMYNVHVYNSLSVYTSYNLHSMSDNIMQEFIVDNDVHVRLHT